MTEKMSLTRRFSHIGTYLYTLAYGVRVGRDQFGNRYYRHRFTPKGKRERRWVVYKGELEASSVPPEWHAWLHHTLDAPIPMQSAYHRAWQKPHEPNMTGTVSAYLPPGHTAMGGRRHKATGDYEAWQPE